LRWARLRAETADALFGICEVEVYVLKTAAFCILNSFVRKVSQVTAQELRMQNAECQVIQVRPEKLLYESSES
jgi:hypothetical protein